MKKKSSHSAVIKSPGRWTGNNIFFKGGLTFLSFFNARKQFLFKIYLPLSTDLEFRP